MPVFELGNPGAMRDKLNKSVFDGTKVCTSSLLAHYEAEGEPVPEVGQVFALIDSDGNRVSAVEITKVDILRLGDVDGSIAVGEGENFAYVNEWRVAHEAFWRSDIANGAPRVTIDGNSMVVVEWFRPIG